MQPSLSPPRTYAVYLIDYPDGSYADNAKPYPLKFLSALRFSTYSAWSFRILVPRTMRR